MKAQGRSSWPPIVTAFAIWFVHFMVCWAAVEIWPRQWPANALAWGATATALPFLGVHFLRIRSQHVAGTLADWLYGFARGAVAIAAVAVLFTALPSLVLLP